MRITEAELKYRKSNIIQCAFRLFCCKGIDKVTIEEIAHAAGVGVTSIYRYFNTKTELLQKTYTILWQEIAQTIVPYTAPSLKYQKNGYEQLCSFMQNFENLFTVHEEYILFAVDYKLYMIREKICLDSKIEHEMLSPIHSAFYDAVKQGQRDGSINAHGDIDIMFYLFWIVMRGYIEEIVVYEKVLQDNQNWKDYFCFVKSIMLRELEAGTILCQK